MPAAPSIRRGWRSWAWPVGLAMVVFCGAYVVACKVGGGASPLARLDQSAPGPRLEQWAKPSVLLGKGKVGEVLHGAFQLRNIGSEPLTFKIRPSCSCADCVPREGQVLPGEAQEVKVDVRLRVSGKTEHVFLQILTNDQQTPESEYSFFAKCPGPVVVKPQSVHFDVLEGKTADVVLPVRDHEGKRLPSATDLQFHSTNPYLDIARVQAEDGGLGLAIKVKANTPRGHFNGEVVLSLPGVEGTLPVAVTGSVLGPVKVSPSTVPLTINGSPAQFVVGRPEDELLGRLVRADVPPGLTIEELSDLQDLRRRFRVQAGPDCKLTGHHTIRLRFENLTEEALVSVKVGTKP